MFGLIHIDSLGVLIAFIIALFMLALLVIVNRVYEARHANEEALKDLAKKHKFSRTKSKNKPILVEGVYKGLAFTASSTVRVHKNLSVHLFVVEVSVPWALPLTEFLPKNKNGQLNGFNSWNIPPVSLMNEIPYKVYSNSLKLVQALDDEGLSSWLQAMRSPVIITLKDRTIEASIKDGFDFWSLEAIEEHLELFLKLSRGLFVLEEKHPEFFTSK